MTHILKSAFVGVTVGLVAGVYHYRAQYPNKLSMLSLGAIASLTLCPPSMPLETVIIMYLTCHTTSTCLEGYAQKRQREKRELEESAARAHEEKQKETETKSDNISVK